MKVYVDELPKCCEKCPLCDCNGFDNNGWCNAFQDKLVYIADETFKEKRLQSCPLKTLKDHDRAVKQHAYKKGYNDMRLQYELGDYTKQVRKDVCEELKNKILYCSERILKDSHYYNGKELDEILDQIQGDKK